MTANEEILNANIRHAIWLERYKTGVAKNIIALLNAVDADLRDQLTLRLMKIEERGYDLSAVTTQRILKMIDTLVLMRSDLYTSAQEETRKVLVDFAEYEASFQARIIHEAVDVKIDMPSVSQFKALVVSRPFQGRILREWFTSLRTNDAKRLQDAIKIGIAEGQTTSQIVQRVIGTKAAKYRDGILEKSRHEAYSVVNTAIAHVATQSADELYQANSDIIKGVQWVSVLDSRTTPTCQARDGKVFPIDSGPRPPAHWNCRSRVVPYLGATSVKGQRASMIGPVPSDMTYSEWLKKQPIALQNEALGVKKATLFREGGLTLDRFVDNSGRAYTLDELKQRDNHAWQQAFPDG
jgi:SPP1 gp7 family putative phage head morphogenesis protein